MTSRIAQQIIAGVLLLGFACLTAWGQATGIVRGQVVDPTGAAIPQATVKLVNPMHRHEIAITTGEDGSFVLYQVPFNPYTLTVEKPGFATYRQLIDIHSSAPLVLEIRLEVGAVTQQVEVTATLLEEDKVSTHINIDAHQIERRAGAAPSRLIESILLEAPGVVADDNGRLHARGAHSQTSFLIDGLPVSDQLSIAFSNPFDVRNVETMEVYTGNFPAEYGNKVGAVVNVSTKSGLGSGRRFSGNVAGSLGSFDAGEVSVQAGGGTEKWGYFVSAAGNRSHRFLDPPGLDDLHNSGRLQSLFFRLDFAPSMKNLFRFSANAGASRFEVPNLPSQHAAGQDQEQRLMDLALRFTWLHTFNHAWALELTPHYRTAVAQLFDSPDDTPVTAAQARHLTTAGGKASLSYLGHGHQFKMGVDAFAFPISEIFSFAITDPGFNDPADPEANPNLFPYDLTPCLPPVRTTACNGTRFLFGDSLTGSEYSFFVQDRFTLARLTVSVGVRYDNYNAVLRRNHWSPRIGLAYTLRKTGTVLRASYNRLFQTPSNENLLLSTSPQVGTLVPPDRITALGAALLIVRPEKDDLYEAGVAQRVKDWFRVDVALFWKRIRDFHDNDQFLNTSVVFPIAISRGRVHGVDLRVDVPYRRGFSGYWTFSTSTATGVSPLTGGLFLGEEALERLAAGPFRPDHDQRFTSQGEISYQHRKSGVWTSLTGRFDSGLPVVIDDLTEAATNPDTAREFRLVNLNRTPFRVQTRLVWDWAVGIEIPHDKPRVGAQFAVLNLTDEERLYNFLSVFSGTHLVAPRSFAGRLRFFF